MLPEAEAALNDDGRICVELEPSLTATLAALAPAVAVCEAPWWLIGSAAMALQGVSPLVVNDVDLLVDIADAARVAEFLGIGFVARPDDLFHSARFARWNGGPLPVEIMSGLQVHRPDGWVAVRPATREAVVAAGLRLFVPSVAELAELCRLFGRPKDLKRLALIERLSASSSPERADPSPPATPG